MSSSYQSVMPPPSIDWGWNFPHFPMCIEPPLVVHPSTLTLIAPIFYCSNDLKLKFMIRNDAIGFAEKSFKEDERRGQSVWHRYMLPSYIHESRLRVCVFTIHHQESRNTDETIDRIILHEVFSISPFLHSIAMIASIASICTHTCSVWNPYGKMEKLKGL